MKITLWIPLHLPPSSFNLFFFFCWDDLPPFFHSSKTVISASKSTKLDNFSANILELVKERKSTYLLKVHREMWSLCSLVYLSGLCSHPAPSASLTNTHFPCRAFRGHRTGQGCIYPEQKAEDLVVSGLLGVVLWTPVAIWIQYHDLLAGKGMAVRKQRCAEAQHLRIYLWWLAQENEDKNRSRLSISSKIISFI